MEKTNKMGGTKGRSGSKKRAAKTPVAADREERLRSAKRTSAAITQVIAVENELRPRTAEWVGAIRARITSLYEEVRAVVHESRPGTVLHRLLDHAQLSNVMVALSEADCEAVSLNVPGYDMPIPPLLVHHKIVCGDRFPLAEEGAKMSATEGGVR